MLSFYLLLCLPHFGIMVNSLLTISIKVNVPVSDVSRLLTTGDDHEVQESECYPWSLELAFRPWLERRWR